MLEAQQCAQRRRPVADTFQPDSVAAIRRSNGSSAGSIDVTDRVRLFAFRLPRFSEFRREGSHGDRQESDWKRTAPVVLQGISGGPSAAAHDNRRPV